MSTPSSIVSGVAAMVALLALTAPAQATVIDGSFSGIMTSGPENSDLISGTFSYNTATFGYPPEGVDGEGEIYMGPVSASYTLNGATMSYPADPNGSIGILTNGLAQTFDLQAGGVYLTFASANLLSQFDVLYANSPNITFAGNNLGGTGTVDGTNFQLNSIDISPVPLPPALSMFGAAFLALASFAMWASRRVSPGRYT